MASLWRDIIAGNVKGVERDKSGLVSFAASSFVSFLVSSGTVAARATAVELCEALRARDVIRPAAGEARFTDAATTRWICRADEEQSPTTSFSVSALLNSSNYVICAPFLKQGSWFINPRFFLLDRSTCRLYEFNHDFSTQPRHYIDLPSQPCVVSLINPTAGTAASSSSLGTPSRRTSRASSSGGGDVSDASDTEDEGGGDNAGWLSLPAPLAPWLPRGTGQASLPTGRSKAWGFSIQGPGIKLVCYTTSSARARVWVQAIGAACACRAARPILSHSQQRLRTINITPPPAVLPSYGSSSHVSLGQSRHSLGHSRIVITNSNDPDASMSSSFSAASMSTAAANFAHMQLAAGSSSGIGSSLSSGEPGANLFAAFSGAASAGPGATMLLSQSQAGAARGSRPSTRDRGGLWTKRPAAGAGHGDEHDDSGGLDAAAVNHKLDQWAELSRSQVTAIEMEAAAGQPLPVPSSVIDLLSIPQTTIRAHVPSTWASDYASELCRSSIASSVPPHVHGGGEEINYGDVRRHQQDMLPDGWTGEEHRPIQQHCQAGDRPPMVASSSSPAITFPWSSVDDATVSSLCPPSTMIELYGQCLSTYCKCMGRELGLAGPSGDVLNGGEDLRPLRLLVLQPQRLFTDVCIFIAAHQRYVIERIASCVGRLPTEDGDDDSYEGDAAEAIEPKPAPVTYDHLLQGLWSGEEAATAATAAANGDAAAQHGIPATGASDSQLQDSGFGATSGLRMSAIDAAAPPHVPVTAAAGGGDGDDDIELLEALGQSSGGGKGGASADGGGSATLPLVRERSLYGPGSLARSASRLVASGQNSGFGGSGTGAAAGMASPLHVSKFIVGAGEEAGAVRHHRHQRPTAFDPHHVFGSTTSAAAADTYGYDGDGDGDGSSTPGGSVQEGRSAFEAHRALVQLQVASAFSSYAAHVEAAAMNGELLVNGAQGAGNGAGAQVTSAGSSSDGSRGAVSSLPVGSSSSPFSPAKASRHHQHGGISAAGSSLAHGLTSLHTVNPHMAAALAEEVAMFILPRQPSTVGDGHRVLYRRGRSASSSSTGSEGVAATTGGKGGATSPPPTSAPAGPPDPSAVDPLVCTRPDAWASLDTITCEAWSLEVARTAATCYEVFRPRKHKQPHVHHLHHQQQQQYRRSSAAGTGPYHSVARRISRERSRLLANLGASALLSGSGSREPGSRRVSFSPGHQHGGPAASSAAAGVGSTSTIVRDESSLATSTVIAAASSSSMSSSAGNDAFAAHARADRLSFAGPASDHFLSGGCITSHRPSFAGSMASGGSHSRRGSAASIDEMARLFGQWDAGAAAGSDGKAAAIADTSSSSSSGPRRRASSADRYVYGAALSQYDTQLDDSDDDHGIGGDGFSSAGDSDDGDSDAVDRLTGIGGLSASRGSRAAANHRHPRVRSGSGSLTHLRPPSGAASSPANKSTRRPATSSGLNRNRASAPDASPSKPPAGTGACTAPVLDTLLVKVRELSSQRLKAIMTAQAVSVLRSGTHPLSALLARIITSIGCLYGRHMALASSCISPQEAVRHIKSDLQPAMTRLSKLMRPWPRAWTSAFVDWGATGLYMRPSATFEAHFKLQQQQQQGQTPAHPAASAASPSASSDVVLTAWRYACRVARSVHLTDRDCDDIAIDAVQTVVFECIGSSIQQLYRAAHADEDDALAHAYRLLWGITTSQMDLDKDLRMDAVAQLGPLHPVPHRHARQIYAYVLAERDRLSSSSQPHPSSLFGPHLALTPSQCMPVHASAVLLASIAFVLRLPINLLPAAVLGHSSSGGGRGGGTGASSWLSVGHSAAELLLLAASASSWTGLGGQNGIGNSGRLMQPHPTAPTPSAQPSSTDGCATKIPVPPSPPSFVWPDYSVGTSTSPASLSPIQHAISLFRLISAYSQPNMKVRVLVATVDALCRCVTAHRSGTAMAADAKERWEEAAAASGEGGAHGSSDASSHHHHDALSTAHINADDLLGLLCHVIIHAGVPCLSSEVAMISDFVSDEMMIERPGFFLTSLQAALTYAVTDDIRGRVKCGHCEGVGDGSREVAVVCVQCGRQLCRSCDALLHPPSPADVTAVPSADFEALARLAAMAKHTRHPAPLAVPVASGGLRDGGDADAAHSRSGELSASAALPRTRSSRGGSGGNRDRSTSVSAMVWPSASVDLSSGRVEGVSKQEMRRWYEEAGHANGQSAVPAADAAVSVTGVEDEDDDGGGDADDLIVMSAAGEGASLPAGSGVGYSAVASAAAELLSSPRISRYSSMAGGSSATTSAAVSRRASHRRSASGHGQAELDAAVTAAVESAHHRG